MHIAIVMDGNGRWAQTPGQPRFFGHREGANAVRRTVEAARREGVDVLTLFAFSSDNWGRPESEVRDLMGLFRSFLRMEALRCLQNGIRLTVIGRRDRLPEAVRAAVEEAEYTTADCSGMQLRIAVDYSGRESILRAARESGGDPEVFRSRMQPDVDLLIRTGGEQRLSDFLLWECSYAELHFTPKMWPEFGGDDLRAALRDFSGRQRRFGRLPQPPEVPTTSDAVAVN